MAKIKTKFICQECGYESPKWMGKCPGCNSWNTFTEEIINKETKKNSRGISSNKVLRLKDIEVKEEKRITTKYMELDRVLGGGIVNSSLVLVGGDPGIGKSTLLMQTGDKVAGQGLKVLYVTGEESARQIKIRAERLEMESDNMYILAETNIDHILKNINELEPDLLILDSIQTIYNPDITSAPGSVSQVKEITSTIMRTTKSTNMSTFIVGHVTKQGSIAGPRVLEHMVDTVLYFEGDTQHSYRILRAVKNRYGSTNEVGVFEMRDSGLEEIINPSSFFLESRTENSYGSVITASMEGTRPLLLEIQALISYSSFGNPRRVTTGVDNSRAAMLMAVLEKKAGMQLQNTDAYINVIGGMQVKETAVDLPILCAIASSFREVKIDSNTLIIGEVGLSGEIRGVKDIDKRIGEANKMGFKRAVVPYSNKKNIKNISDDLDMEIIKVKNIEEALNVLL